MKIVHDDGAVTLWHADCLDVLRAIPDNSIEACVTDPPYGIGTRAPGVDEIVAYLQGASLNTGGDFMGRDWTIPPLAVWREIARVLKPGGHAIVFAGDRTFDLIGIGLRAAGLQIRTSLCWLYGEGWNKVGYVDRLIDRAAGVEAVVLDEHATGWQGTLGGRAALGGLSSPDVRRTTAAATDDARRWSGWAGALKPAWEPALLCRKAPDGTMAENLLRHGVGAFHVDACRVPSGGTHASAASVGTGAGHGGEGNGIYNGVGGVVMPAHPRGRWPATVLLGHGDGCVRAGTKRVRGGGVDDGTRGTGGFWSDESNRPCGPQYADADGFETVDDWRCTPNCPAALLDAQVGERASGRVVTRRDTIAGHQGGVYGAESRESAPVEWYGDSGSVSRFFYSSKAASSERVFLCRDCDAVFPADTRKRHQHDHTDAVGRPTWEHLVFHVAVKPLDLCRWLVRLICPVGGTVLDPFAGTGSVGVAASRERMRYVGIERDADYVRLAHCRLVDDAPLFRRPAPPAAPEPLTPGREAAE